MKGPTSSVSHVDPSRELVEAAPPQRPFTPKRVAQLVRFDHAAHLLAAGHAAASMASESGYVDQSHLHREVKTFTRLTPTAVAPWLAIDDIAWPASSR